MTTPIDIAELRRLERAATPGPWAWYSYGEKCYGFAVVTCFDENDAPVAGHVESNNDGIVDGICYSEQQSGGIDMPFIVAARNAMPGLLNELEALRERVQAMELEAHNA